MSLLSLAGYAAMRLLLLTYRFRYTGQQHLDGIAGTYLLATWHQNLFAGIAAQYGRRHVVMVSRSRHADALTYTCARLGNLVVRGSSRKGGVDKGGRTARDEMIGALQAGVPGAVTVDGPKGPPHEVKPGIIDMAGKTQLPIIPYAALAERYWGFSTWDSFRLPKPFTRIHVHYGAPMRIAADIGEEQFVAAQLELGQRISALDGDSRSARSFRRPRR